LILLDTYPSLTVRDALHAAATLHTGAEGLCSYDRDFDEIKGLHRIEP
jgi:predicted nucleic acid-binding protein